MQIVENISNFPMLYMYILLHGSNGSYGKCSKILNTFLFLFSNTCKMMVIKALNSQNAFQNSKQGSL